MDVIHYLLIYNYHDYPLRMLFGILNGSYSSSINPTALYTQEGTYDILLFLF